MNSTSLKVALENYLQKATEVLNLKEIDRQLSSILGATPRNRQLRRLIVDLHESEDFNLLIEASAAALGKSGKRSHFASWHIRIAGYLDSIGVYRRLSDSESIDVSEIYEGLIEELKRETVPYSYLIPLHGIQFGADRMNFSGFTVRRFTADEISAFFNSPGVSARGLGDEEARLISGYWYLQLHETRSVARPGILQYSRDEWLEDASAFVPTAASVALRTLSLMEWPMKEWPLPWFKFSNTGKFLGEHARIQHTRILWIPFLLKFVDGRLSEDVDVHGVLKRLFDLEELETLERMDANGDVVDTVDQMRTHIHYTEKDQRRIDSLVSLHTDLMTLKDATLVESDFLFRAIEFTYLAAITRDRVQSFLWNVMAIEALFGIRGESTRSLVCGVTHVYSRSDSSGIGESKYFKKEKKERFAETGIYDARSKLVHGAVRPDDLTMEHVAIARVMARDCVEWVSNFLVQVHTLLNESNDATKFSREHFLAFISIPPDALSLHKAISKRLL